MPELASIDSPERFQTALQYTAENALELGKKVVGRQMKIDTLCLFAHSPSEYEFIRSQVEKYGDRSPYSHGKTFYVASDFFVLEQYIRLLGVREPDEDRPEVGYADYPVHDLEAMAQGLEHNSYATPVTSGRGRPLIELRHPDFDVRGYITEPV